MFLKLGILSHYIFGITNIKYLFLTLKYRTHIRGNGNKEDCVPLGGFSLNTGLSTKYPGDVRHGILFIRVLFIQSLRITMPSSQEYKFIYAQCWHISRTIISILETTGIKYWNKLEFIFQIHKILDQSKLGYLVPFSQFCFVSFFPPWPDLVLRYLQGSGGSNRYLPCVNL